MALYYIAQAFAKDRSELITQLVCRLNGEDRIIERRAPLLMAEQDPQSEGHGKLITLRSEHEGRMVVRDFQAIIALGRYKGVNPQTGDPVEFEITKVESIEAPTG